ncbi:response regulator [uncultured Rhodospira sp.]|uniref:response regulator n=1 Tax=uncultured Rhodospira sp. TaxID=1936189 RepID=UPI00260C6037|nr:response regulator [uncultured Rhodospira sp.]
MNEIGPEHAALRRVLVVEDDQAVRELAAVALADVGGLQALTCATGTEALERGPGFGPDLLLLDLQLADIDGPELLRAYRAKHGPATPPTVLLTGRPDLAEDTRSADPAIIGVLAKPFEPMSLAERLRGMWQGWRDASRS